MKHDSRLRVVTFTYCCCNSQWIFPRPPKGREVEREKLPFSATSLDEWLFLCLFLDFSCFFFILRKQAPKWIHCEQVEHCSTQQSIRICSLKGSTRGGKLKLKKLVQWRVYLAIRVCVVHEKLRGRENGPRKQVSDGAKHAHRHEKFMINPKRDRKNLKWCWWTKFKIQNCCGSNCMHEWTFNQFVNIGRK